MPLAVTINGLPFTIPETTDKDWGDAGTTILKRLLQQGTAIYSVLWYDADSTGASDTGDDIEACIAAADDNGGIVYFPPGTYKIGDEVDGNLLTVPSNVTLWFADGATLQKLSTTAVTINGYLIAPRSQIFTGFDPADITYGSKVSPIYQEWQGLTAEDEYTVQMKVLRVASAFQTITAAASIDIDYADGYNARISVDTNISSITISHPRDGERLLIKFNQTGSYTVAGWPANVLWSDGVSEPTITSVSGEVSIVTLIYDSTDDHYVGEYKERHS